MPRARSTGRISYNKRENRTRRVRSASSEKNLLKPLFEAVRRRSIEDVEILIEKRALRSKRFYS